MSDFAGDGDRAWRRRTWLDIEHHLHRLLPEGDHRVQAREVEVVLDEVFRYFTEVFVSGQRAEPTNPGQRRSRRRRTWNKLARKLHYPRANLRDSRGDISGWMAIDTYCNPLPAPRRPP